MSHTKWNYSDTNSHQTTKPDPQLVPTVVSRELQGTTPQEEQWNKKHI
jgi:hypothetical protein